MSSTFVPKHNYVVYEYMVFMLQEEEPVLIAQYFSDDEMPKVGDVLQITVFKIAPIYPDQVKVLRIEALDYIKTSHDDPAKFSIIAEPYFSK